jgi:hypothetical protein
VGVHQIENRKSKIGVAKVSHSTRAERNAIVNGVLAAQAGLNVGDIIPLSTPEGQQEYRVVAIGGDVLAMKINTAYISQAVMREDFRKSEDVFYQINLAPGANPATVEQWLNAIVVSRQ